MIIYEENFNGGLSLSGDSDFKLQIEISGQGGILITSTEDYFLNINLTSIAITMCGGSSLVNLINNDYSNGGALCEGSSLANLINSDHSDGGVLCSGDVSILMNEISSGGVTCSGVAIKEFIKHGHVVCAGEATVTLYKLRGLYISGLNDFGQVGDGTTTFRYKPQFIDDSFNKFSAGLRHCLAINENKELYAWGQNLNGRLGDGSQTNRFVPTKIGSNTNWEKAIGSWNFSLAVNSNGELYSWGNNISGNLGYEPRSDVLSPKKIGEITTYKVTVAAGLNSFGSGNKFYLNGVVSPNLTLEEGKTYRFDQSDVSNFNHPIRLSTTSNGTHNSGTVFDVQVTTVGVAGTSGSYLEITVVEGVPNLYYYCQNHSGMGGSINVIADDGSVWEKVSAGRHVLAIKSNGELYSWGENEFGQLGSGVSGGTTSRSTVIRVGEESNWVEIAAGYDHSIAINSAGELWACGRNDYGQVGNGTQNNQSSLIKIGSANNWVKVAAGRDHSLAINSLGELYSWGRNQNNYFQLGLGDETESFRSSPTKIGTLTNWIDVAAGFHHSIALNSENRIYGFGYNGYGSLGDNTSASKSQPTLINFIENVLSIEAGGYVTLSFVYLNITELPFDGALVSGDSWFSSGVPIEGGATLNGEADLDSILGQQNKISVLLNGSSNFYLIISQTIEENGSLCSGDSTVTRTFNEVASGGASCGGQSISGISLVFTGGVTNGGLAVNTQFMALIGSKASIVLNGFSNFAFKFNLSFSGSIDCGGFSIIGIQPKVGGTCLVSGNSPEIKLSIPVVGLGSLSANGNGYIYILYITEKYQRGQLRLRPKGRIEYLKKLTKVKIKNIGLSMETSNILNFEILNTDSLIQTTQIPPENFINIYRVQYSPGWCEFGEECDSAYVPDVVKNRQGKYMPSKKRDIVPRGGQIALLTQE